MIKNSIVAIIKPQTEILNFKMIYGLISNFNFSIRYLLNVYRFFTNLIKLIDSWGNTKLEHNSPKNGNHFCGS